MKIDLPASLGQPLMQANIKLAPSDFIVKEQLGFDLDHTGEHLYLHIRKCGLNTNDIVTKLQTIFECRSVDIGVSGLKDKNAITDQWFSVRTPKNIDEISMGNQSLPSGTKEVIVPMEGEYVLLEAPRHSRKLRRGAHQYNQFIITLRNIKASENDAAGQLPLLLQQRLNLLESQGFANYFGPQRFGHQAQNLVKADRLFKSPKRKISRAQRGILLSAARSQLFNEVCAERVRQGSWNKPMHGDAMLLTGTNSYFSNDNTDKTVNSRCDAHDIQPTGPLWGRGKPLTTAESQVLESTVLGPYKAFMHGLEHAGLEQQRRALRAHVHSLQHEWIDDQSVKLNFKLLKGVYATSFLGEFMINY